MNIPVITFTGTSSIVAGEGKFLSVQLTVQLKAVFVELLNNVF